MPTLPTHLIYLIHVLLIYGCACVFGVVAKAFGLPLPWMIGAMLFSMAVRLAGRPVHVPLGTRPFGQMLVASSVGLAFTPEAVSATAALLVPMLTAAFLTIAAGFAAAAVLMRLAHVDAVTATLASLPMRPVESANLAGRHRIEAGPVAFSQTLRITLLVLLVPPALVWLDGSVEDPSAALRDLPWTPTGALLLFACGGLGALIARVAQIANPFFVGSIAGAAMAAALTLPISAYPYPVLAGAQVLLGVSLGAVFDQALIRRTGAFLAAACVSTVVLVALCLATGAALAWATGLALPVLILSTAPGSVTEMALTAKVLEQGVAIVTAFHLTRIFIILPFAPVIISLTVWAARRWGIGPPLAPRQ